MAARKNMSRREGMYDHVYDQVYTVSSDTDHAKAKYRAYASRSRVRILPEFESMFSDRPNYSVKLHPAEAVPALVNHPWRGPEAMEDAGMEQNRQAWLAQECRVTGADYWKYLKRPLMVASQPLFPYVKFDQETLEVDDDEFGVRTVGVQTDYRESEAQTDPYSPEYYIRPGATAIELLYLAAFSWGRGLPAGLDEVEMIEWARAKRALEASLPSLYDLKQMQKRRRQIVEIQAKDWAFRESRIQKLHDVRLAALKERLRRRRDSAEELCCMRLNLMSTKFQEKNEIRLEKTHNDQMRAGRKLEAKRTSVEKKGDIVTIFKGYLVNNRNVDVPTNQTSDTLQAMEEQPSTAEDNPPAPRVKIERHKNKAAKCINMGKRGNAVDLLLLYKTQLAEQKIDRRKKTLRLLVRRDTTPPPPTPKDDSPLEWEEMMELAAIKFQKLLRGRRIQCEMFHGKENNLDLIRELQSVHALQLEEQEMVKADEEYIRALKEYQHEEREEIKTKEAYESGVTGEENEILFDTLSKEMIRLQDERRIHAFVLLAERERRRREAEESGKRQEEERKRREEDEIFKQVVQVHQKTVDMYLEDIILETLDTMSGEKAREEIYLKLKEINDIAYAMEKSRNLLQSEEIVAELLYSHLIPGVEKTIFWQKVHHKQQTHLEAARSIIHTISSPTSSARIAPSPSSMKSTSEEEEESAQEAQDKDSEATPSDADSNH